MEGKFRLVAGNGDMVELDEEFLPDCCCFWKGSTGRTGEEEGGTDFAMAEECGLPLELLETEF